MVTQAITTAATVVSTIKAVTNALDEIKAARKDCAALAKAGLAVQARKLETELDRQEAKLKRSLSRAIAARIKARSKARAQSRTRSGQFS